MASILNTDLGSLFDQWGQRVAFNEGYRMQQLADAKEAGKMAASLGVDKREARSEYLQSLASEPSVIADVDDLGVVDDLGAVDDLGVVDDLGEVGEQFVNECPVCSARFHSGSDGFDAVLCSSCSDAEDLARDKYEETMFTLTAEERAFFGVS